MKKLLKFICLLVSLYFSIGIFSSQAVLALSDIPFAYNVLPEETNQSIIDTNVQKKLGFKLYEPVEAVYYNEKQVKIQDNRFQIDVSNLSGKTTITFQDSENQTVSFSYYFSDKKGRVPGYELVKEKDLTTYVTTYKNIKIIYSDKEKSASTRLVSYLKKLPTKLIENVTTITMIPYENTANIAGITKESTITLYQFSQYSSTTQKNIIYHEVAHTWANYLMQNKVMDYSYSDYAEFVKADKNFVSNYSKKDIEEKERYSEDFAESVSFYFINQRSFKKNYPQRFQYIDSLVKLKIEEKTDEKIKVKTFAFDSSFFSYYNENTQSNKIGTLALLNPIFPIYQKYYNK